MVRVLLLAMVCGLVSGCAHDRVGSRLATWQGSHFDEVTASWGVPAECTDIDTLRVCKWHIRPTAVTVTATSFGSSSCTTMLAFDEQDIVTGWRWRGDRCQQNITAVVSNLDRSRPDVFDLDGENEPASDIAVVE